jgi:hypothetical protein
MLGRTTLPSPPWMLMAANAHKPGQLRPYEVETQPNLGVLLLEFLEFYGNDLNYEKVGLSVRGKGSFYDKVVFLPWVCTHSKLSRLTHGWWRALRTGGPWVSQGGARGSQRREPARPRYCPSWEGQASLCGRSSPDAATADGMPQSSM